MRNMTGGVALFFFCFFIVGISGWVMNLINVIKYLNTGTPISDIEVMFIAQVIGVFVAPIGAFLGWVV